MQKKKVLFSSYLHGNMEALIDYYNSQLKKEYNEKLDIIYLDLSQIEKKGKVSRYIKKFIEFNKKYDMVVSDYVSPILNTGREAIFMDHGSSLKMMPGLDEVGDPKIQKLGKLFREKVKYMVTLSEREEEFFYKPKEFENYKLPQYIPLGQPRNDVLFNKDFINSSREDICNKFNIKNKKIILYAPTWRGYDVADCFPFNRKDFEKLNEYLELHGYVFLYRPHYIENFIKDDLIKGLSSIVLADVNKEPYTQKILAAADMVITDYSSIIVDFLIMNKPMAFIPFDLEKYDKFRGLVINFKDDVHTPGPKIYEMDNLIEYIKAIDENRDMYTDFRKKAIKYYYTYFDDKSCERIWKLMLEELI